METQKKGQKQFLQHFWDSDPEYSRRDVVRNNRRISVALIEGPTRDAPVLFLLHGAMPNCTAESWKFQIHRFQNRFTIAAPGIVQN
jgi:hypothetical protein